MTLYTLGCMAGLKRRHQAANFCFSSELFGAGMPSLKVVISTPSQVFRSKSESLTDGKRMVVRAEIWFKKNAYIDSLNYL